MDARRRDALERSGQDAVVQAAEQLSAALDRFTRWPWSHTRRQALVVALNTVQEVWLARMIAICANLSADPLVTLKEAVQRIEQQQGRHERRLSRLEAGREQQAGGRGDV